MSVSRHQAGALLGSMSSLIRSARAAAHRHSSEMGAAGTPLAMLKALCSGPTRPSDLATTLQVAPSVVSRTIVRLEQTGLVERTPDPDDARATRIALTDLGHARLDQLQQAYVDEVRSVLDSWTDAEAAQAATFMQRLDEAISLTYTDEAQRRLLASALIPTGLPDDDGPSLPQPAALASA